MTNLDFPGFIQRMDYFSQLILQRLTLNIKARLKIKPVAQMTGLPHLYWRSHPLKLSQDPSNVFQAFELFSINLKLRTYVDHLFPPVDIYSQMRYRFIHYDLSITNCYIVGYCKGLFAVKRKFLRQNVSWHSQKASAASSAVSTWRVRKKSYRKALQSEGHSQRLTPRQRPNMLRLWRKCRS